MTPTAPDTLSSVTFRDSITLPPLGVVPKSRMTLIKPSCREAKVPLSTPPVTLAYMREVEEESLVRKPF